MSRCSVTAAVAPSSNIARARDFQATFASARGATAPMPATAAGTTEPTARNFDATATPHDSPSADRATIEKVMAAPLGPRRASIWNLARRLRCFRLVIAIVETDVTPDAGPDRGARR